jgi:streptogramin lyase
VAAGNPCGTVRSVLADRDKTATGFACRMDVDPTSDLVSIHNGWAYNKRCGPHQQTFVQHNTMRYLIPILGALLCCLPAQITAIASAEAKLQITTLVGTGEKGYSGDGGPAVKAQLNSPFGVVQGPDSALYICDTMNHVIRRVGANGTITTVAGCGRKGYSGDGGAATKAELNEPYEIRFDRAGHMFFVEMRNNLVRRVDARTHIISTVVGTGKEGFSGDGGPAEKSEMRSPHSIQFGPEGSLYICDIGNHRIRKVDTKTYIITTFAGTGEQLPTPDGAIIAGTPLNGPRAIDFDARGDMWLALREGNRVFRLDLKAGTIHHVAGTGRTGFSGNGGPAKDATLSGPKGIAVGPDGNVYLADTESHSVRLIDVKKGTIDLVAGTGEAGDGPEGNPLACRMNRLHGVFVDVENSVFVGDTSAHRVRVIRVKRGQNSQCQGSRANLAIPAARDVSHKQHSLEFRVRRVRPETFNHLLQFLQVDLLIEPGHGLDMRQTTVSGATTSLPLVARNSRSEPRR